MGETIVIPLVVALAPVLAVTIAAWLQVRTHKKLAGNVEGKLGEIHVLVNSRLGNEIEARIKAETRVEELERELRDLKGEDQD